MKQLKCIATRFLIIPGGFGRRLAVAGFLLWAWAALVVSTRANTLSWSGGGGANAYWNNTANWGFAGIPANGDTVIFPASQPNLINTNNLTELVLNQIRFAGANGGYDLRGNAFTLTNSILATNTAGANLIENNITLAGTANVLVTVSNGVSLTLEGNLSSSGMVGVTMMGLGALLYQCTGDNTYSGTTLVSEGTLEFNVSGANAVSGPLVIGDSSGAGYPMVLDLQYDEMDSLPSVAVNLNGHLNLNNFNEPYFSTNVILNSGGDVETGTGVLTFLPNSTITGDYDGTSSEYLQGFVNTGSGNLTIQGDSYLWFLATTSGSANIIQNGAIITIWDGTNTYSGNYTVNGTGAVYPAVSRALGNITNQLTLNDQAYLEIGNNAAITNQSVTFNGPGNGYAGNIWVTIPATNTWSAKFILNTNCVITVDNSCSFDMNGPISGPGGITETGSGTLIYSGATANTYAGLTQVNAGELELAKSGAQAIAPYEAGLVVGDGTNDADVVYGAGQQIYSVVTPVVVNGYATLNLNGFSDTVSPLTLSNGVVNTSGGQLGLGNVTVTGYESYILGTVVPQSPALTIDTTAFLEIYANIIANGNAGLTQSGGPVGGTDLWASNSYNGPTVVQVGYVRLLDSSALGGTNSPAVIGYGADLTLTGVAVTNKPLVLNGSGGSFYSALEADGVSVWAGPVTNNGNSVLFTYDTNAELHINGPISGAGSLELSTFSYGGGGTTFFEGAASNSYAGPTTIDASNILVLNKSFRYDAMPGNVVVNGILQCTNTEQINVLADVLVNGGGWFELGTFPQDMNTLHGTGNVTFGTNGFLVIGQQGGSSEFDGVMSGTGYPGGYTVGKFGTGTFTMGGNNTYLNQSEVFGGSLIINGYQPQNPVMVFPGCTLGGSGTVGAINSSGVIAPGNNPGLGILTSSGVGYSSEGSLKVEIAGVTPGTGYDQLNVTGPVNLASATLQLNMPVAGLTNSQLTIINNQGAAAVVGTFAGLPEGATVVADNGAKFKITYQGGTGKSVVLTQISLPSQPKLSGITELGGDGVQLNGLGYTNLAYTIEASTNLTTTNWVNIGTATANGSGQIQFIDPNAPDFPLRFYRFSFP